MGMVPGLCLLAWCLVTLAVWWYVSGKHPDGVIAGAACAVAWPGILLLLVTCFFLAVLAGFFCRVGNSIRENERTIPKG